MLNIIHMLTLCNLGSNLRFGLRKRAGGARGSSAAVRCGGWRLRSPKYSSGTFSGVVLPHNETADSNTHIYDTKGLIIIVIIPLSSRYCLHASNFKTALADSLLPQTFFFF